MTTPISFPLSIAGLLSALLLGACGGTGGSDGEARGPAAEASLFVPMAEYCGIKSPETSSVAGEGWDTAPTPMNAYRYMANSLRSLAGSSQALDGGQALSIEINDYRGIAANSLPTWAGASDTAWVMGARIPTVLAPRSIACTVHLSKLRNNYTQPAGWSTYWHASLPMAQLPGHLIDGFEFVSNFTPADSAIYFVLDKERYGNLQAPSLCYLAPHKTQWECAAASLVDAGKRWQVHAAGLRAGAYALVSSSRR
jgi:hypothetical protein